MLFDVTQYRVERCPKCGSKDIQRSRRKSIVDFAVGFALRPWRCMICFVRFYRPRWMKAAPRRVELGARRFETKAASAKTSAASASARSSFHASEETTPGIVKRHPLLGFFPAGHEVGDMQDSVTFRAEQLRS